MPSGRSLSRPWERLREILLEESNEGQRLRSSHPFTGILTQDERDAIYARHGIDIPRMRREYGTADVSASAGADYTSTSGTLNRGVLTPYAGMTFGDAGERTVRTGTRWQLGPDAVLGLEGSRQASDAGEADNELRLRAALRF